VRAGHAANENVAADVSKLFTKPLIDHCSSPRIRPEPLAAVLPTSLARA
jgi:hypothetical protein